MKARASRPSFARVAAILLVTVVPLLFHWATIFSDDRTIPWDFLNFHLPHLVVMREAAANRTFPLWDSYNYCGRPFAANPQTQSFYLPRWVTVLTARSTPSLVSRLEVEVLVHIICAGLFTLLLAWRLGFDSQAAALAGVAYGSGCFIASQLQHVGMIELGAWLPAAAWAVVRLIQSPRHTNAILLGAILATAYLTGFMPAVLVLYAASFLLLLLLLWAFRKPALRPLSLFAIACLFSLGVVSFQLIPSIELAQHSVGKYRLDWRGTGGGIPWESLVSLIWPDYYGVSDLSRFRLKQELTFCYLFNGFIPLILVAAAFRYARRVRIVAAMTALLIISAACMLGDHTMFGLSLWRLIPEAVRGAYYPSSWIMVFSFGVALVSAAVLSQTKLRAAIKWALVVLTAGELLYFNSNLPMNSTSYRPDERISNSAYLGDAATPAALAPGPAPANARFDIVHESEQWVFNASLLGRLTANGYDPLALERVIQSRLFFAEGHRWGALYKVERPESAMLAAMNVDYLVSSEPLPLQADSTWRCVRSTPRWVYRRTDPSSRVYFVPSVVRAGSMGDAVTAARNPSWNPRKQAVAEEPGSAATDLPVGEVEVISYKPGEIQLRTTNTGLGFLYLSEAYYPGWRALIDGSPAGLVAANVAFQGLWVPAGAHDVTIRFEPSIFVQGGLLSAGTVIAGGVLLIWRYRRQRGQ
ncbi:MAG: hypothetical protein IRZ15_09815 [Bryobacteraceae bacterium]|nr:hypothetical protein [Bryobacteraceae bacterium]